MKHLRKQKSWWTEVLQFTYTYLMKLVGQVSFVTTSVAERKAGRNNLLPFQAESPNFFVRGPHKLLRNS